MVTFKALFVAGATAPTPVAGSTASKPLHDHREFK